MTYKQHIIWWYFATILMFRSLAWKSCGASSPSFTEKTALALNDAGLLLNFEMAQHTIRLPSMIET